MVLREDIHSPEIARLPIKIQDHGKTTDEIAGVGACKEHDCVYNRDLECTADGIDVRSHAGHAECATYKKT